MICSSVNRAFFIAVSLEDGFYLKLAEFSGLRSHPIDKHLYAQRHLIECCFSKLKQFRRVATRFEKTARNYLAVVTLAAIVLWIR